MKSTIFIQCLCVFAGLFTLFPSVHAITYGDASSSQNSSYTTLRSIDLGTYNEYRYRLTEQFFAMREYFEVNNALDPNILQNIALLANTGYKYLPDNLNNQNKLRELLIDIQKGIKTPDNTILYSEIVNSLAAYLENVEIAGISGNITATPTTGNAPLTTTFRANVQDPSGTQILPSDYTWWVDSAGKKVIIGRGPSTNYTFTQEGTYSVFLDVTSSHKNTEGYTDVLPYRERIQVSAQEKIASLIINIDGDKVEDNEVLKFTPDDANYGLLFDASSSTPTGGAQFVSTYWDFGNGATRGYAGPPKVERVRYGNEGDYQVRLRLETNEGKVIEKTFALIIRDPIARIESNRDDGYIGESFTFSAKSSGLDRNLTYNWEIIDIENDTVIIQKTDKVLTHVFTQKGRYNVQLRVRQSSGEIDQDNYIVYVTSQAPIAQFNSSIPLPNKPNRVLLDASRSHDPDFSDNGNLKYDWFIDGEKVRLEEANSNESVGYYSFDSIGNHSVNLEVTDPDGMVDIKKGNVQINSTLSVEMTASPRAIQRGNFIKFTVNAPEAEVFEWDFGDGKKSGGSFDTITHTYEKSGTYTARIKVTDKNNKTNTYAQTVYVSESDTPLAYSEISYGSFEIPVFDESACSGNGAYIIDRVNTVRFDASDSINIDGSKSGLEYSWKIGQGKFANSANVSHRFDEIGCFPVKLTVKSQSNGKTDIREIMMEVRNVKPTLSSLTLNIENPDVDPLIIRVTAQGAEDPDGIIQSYLWYYYTDIDPEPQDFRSTATNATAFVIPKITGTYYFVAILKDNNESRVTSEEITGSRFFSTITGDNINTPIVELEANDTSTVIGEEITFTAKAQNILGQTLDRDVSYSWDFDGDGFYDTQTTQATTTYTYRKSGEFYAKVKVKYRGISSTKNITMNVSNKLVPDFGYISIGNTYIFFDTSTGKIDSRKWDLGDGTTKTGTNFTHTYTDKATSHNVTLKITEGTTVKEVEKKVTKNIKNILKSKGKSFVGFSYPASDADGVINLDSPSETVFVYMAQDDENTETYAIDYDTSEDSDLNGGTDDDEDNAGTSSYTSGDLIAIPLNQFKTQNIRLFTKDASGTVLNAQDLTIVKDYIEETEIDPNTLIFEGVSESEKQKIDELKSFMSDLPQNQRLQAMNYIQKLQENWDDNTEKTRTILDFENYIFELGLDIDREDQIINLLESLLVEGQEDQSTKQITYTALVNLIPQDIACETSAGTCYDSLLSKLEDIRSSDDVEYNKTLGKEILEVVGATDTMTNQQKIDFKAILTSFVYGGSVEDIPEEEKNEIVSEEIPEETAQSDSTLAGKILSILLSIIKWIAILIGIFLCILLLLYLVYLIFGRNNNANFTSFIGNITGSKKSSKNTQNNKEEEIVDILGDFDAEETKEETSDILSQSLPVVKKEVKTLAPSNTQDKKIQEKNNSPEEIPDWLKGAENLSEKATEKKEVKVKEEKKVENPQSGILSPLEDKGENKHSDNLEVKAKQKVAPVEKKLTENKEKNINAENEKKIIKTQKKNVTEEKIDLDTETKTDDNIPDWLKGAADFSAKPKKEKEVESESKTEETQIQNKKPEDKEKKINAVNEEKIINTQESKTRKEKNDLYTETKIDDNIPDWLKGAADFSAKPKKEKEVESESKTEETKTTSESPNKRKEETIIEKNINLENEKKNSEIKTEKESSSKENKKSQTTPKKTESKTESPKKIEKDKGEELWDDGMKIPDWLKTDD